MKNKAAGGIPSSPLFQTTPSINFPSISGAPLMKGQANLPVSDTSSPTTAANVPVLYYIPAPYYTRLSAHLIDRLIFYILLLTFTNAISASTYTLLGIAAALSLGILCIYIWLARKGQTIGKAATRCKIVTYEGETARLSVIAARETIGKLISAILAVGFLWALFDKDRRTLHDIIMKTYVIDCSRKAQIYARAADKRTHQHNLKNKKDD